MANKKVYFIEVRRVSFYRPDTVTVYGGTIDDFVNEIFSYTLECGHSWEPKVNRYPKSFNSLIKNLNKANEASCSHYQNTYYNLASDEQIAAYKEKYGEELGHGLTIR